MVGLVSFVWFLLRVLPKPSRATYPCQRLSFPLAPGFIMTEMTDKLPEEVKESWIKTIPLRRGGTPEDVANACIFLGSELSSYVSGQVINVCGAMQT